MSLDESRVKTNRVLLLLILLLDLIGFAVIFPVVPELLQYYERGVQAGGLDGWLPPLVAAFKGMLPESGDIIVLLGGLLGSLYAILQFFTAPYWGRLSDRIGRRPVLLLTSGMLVLSYGVWFISTSFTVFVISRVLGGLAAGNIGVATAAMADMSTAENRTREMGLVGAAFGVGFIIGPALGGLASQWDMSATFPDSGFLHPFSFCALLSILLSGASALLNLSRFQETLPDSGSSRPWVGSPLGGLRKGFASPGFRRVLLLNFLYTLAFSAFEFTITFFYKLDFGLGPAQIGLVFVYIGVLIAVGQGGLVRRLAPRLGERKLTLLGLALMPAPLYLLSLTAPVVALSLLCLLPISLGASFLQPALTGLASLLAPDEKQGVALGVFRSAGSLARAVGPLLGAYIYWMLGPTLTYLILALVMALNFFPALYVREPGRD